MNEDVEMGGVGSPRIGGANNRNLSHSSPGIRGSGSGIGYKDSRISADSSASAGPTGRSSYANAGLQHNEERVDLESPEAIAHIYGDPLSAPSTFADHVVSRTQAK